MREMQRINGHGSFVGYARELCTDVDARHAVRHMRQHRRPLDPSSSDDSAHSENQTVYVACRTTGASACTGGIAGLPSHVTGGHALLCHPRHDAEVCWPSQVLGCTRSAFLES